jgi:hypothetical protein
VISTGLDDSSLFPESDQKTGTLDSDESAPFAYWKKDKPRLESN